MDDPEVKLAYIDHCGTLISDKDPRELALVMSLRVAGADAELAGPERNALGHLAKSWKISLSDVLAPYV